MNNAECMTIKMKREYRSSWNYLLQKGFFLHGQSGRTVRQFLIETVGYDDCFIDETVRTIFLNNSPVDDIDDAFVRNGDKMALGSAMPGLVGICMGRDNPYKSFRSGIACDGGADESGEVTQIRVFMKIFSVLAVKTGSDILKRGIEMNNGQLADYLAANHSGVLLSPDVVTLNEDREGFTLFSVQFE